MSDDESSNEEEDVNLGHYEGERNEEEQRHGYGKAYFPNGDLYEGNYENGKRHGTGSYHFIGGSVYDGNYAWNKKDGYGIFIYPDGSKYEGNWCEDTRNGEGTYYYVNGDIYKGEWFRNKKNGHGVYFDVQSGAKTEGAWHSGKLNGKAKVDMGSHLYEGTYKDNVINGAGKFQFPSKKIEILGRYDVIEKIEELTPEEGTVIKCKSVWTTFCMKPLSQTEDALKKEVTT